MGLLLVLISYKHIRSICRSAFADLVADARKTGNKTGLRQNWKLVSLDTPKTRNENKASFPHIAKANPLARSECFQIHAVIG